MAVDLRSTAKTNLNGSMSAAQDVNLGTRLASNYTAVAGDATANLVDFTTGLSAISGWIVQIYRAGVNVTADAIVTATGGTLRVADGAATYVVTANDVMMVMVW